jgi:hypothetical protein
MMLAEVDGRQVTCVADLGVIVYAGDRSELSGVEFGSKPEELASFSLSVDDLTS